MADSSLDGKLLDLRLEYGMAGLGLYWYMVENIALKTNVMNLEFRLDMSMKALAHNAGMSVSEVKNMVVEMNNLGLISYDHQHEVVYIPKLAEMSDEHTAKEVRNHKRKLLDEYDKTSDLRNVALKWHKLNFDLKELEELSAMNKEDRKRLSVFTADRNGTDSGLTPDQLLTNSVQTPDQLRSNSGVTPDKLRETSPRSDKSRVDQIRVDKIRSDKIRSTLTTITRITGVDEKDIYLCDHLMQLRASYQPELDDPNPHTWITHLAYICNQVGRDRRKLAELFEKGLQDSWWRSRLTDPRKVDDNWDKLIMLGSESNTESSPDESNVFDMVANND